MDETPGFRPLYRQVYDYLVRQIATGVWRPAEALPSEQDLAAVQAGQAQTPMGTPRKVSEVPGLPDLSQGQLPARGVNH